MALHLHIQLDDMGSWVDRADPREDDKLCLLIVEKNVKTYFLVLEAQNESALEQYRRFNFNHQPYRRENESILILF